MEQTSRLRILDAVELIANQIAISSHCQELINEYMADYDLEPQEDLHVKILHQQSLLRQSINLRRMVMDNLMQTFEDSDKNMWCLFKHSIASYMYAVECSQVSGQNIGREDIQQRAYMQMLQVLSLFLGVEPQLCGRCLQDILHDKLTDNVRMMQQKESSNDSSSGIPESTSIPTKKGSSKPAGKGAKDASGSSRK